MIKTITVHDTDCNKKRKRKEKKKVPLQSRGSSLVQHFCLDCRRMHCNAQDESTPIIRFITQHNYNIYTRRWIYRCYGNPLKFTALTRLKIEDAHLLEIRNHGTGPAHETNAISSLEI